MSRGYPTMGDKIGLVSTKTFPIPSLPLFPKSYQPKQYSHGSTILSVLHLFFEQTNPNIKKESVSKRPTSIKERNRCESRIAFQMVHDKELKWWLTFFPLVLPLQSNGVNGLASVGYFGKKSDRRTNTKVSFRSQK